jgi:hypothetical protein
MTWEAELSLVRTPMIDNWDFSSVPVAWPGQKFDPPSRTGDRSDPAIWIDFGTQRAGSEFLASGGSNARRVSGSIVCGIMVESIIGNDLIHRQQADLLQGYYQSASSDSIFFYVLRAILSGPRLWEDAWQRLDWICPFDAFRAL